MTNVLFVDIDGTLIANKNGRQFIPPSALKALQDARTRGALVYLCTGRSPAEVGVLGKLPVDGAICAAGGYVRSGSTTVFHQSLGRDVVEELERYLHEHGAHYYLETNDGMYFDQAFLDFALSNWGIRDTDAWLQIVHPAKDADRDRINKLCFRSEDGRLSFDELVAAFEDRLYIVPSSFDDPNVVAGEASCAGVNKGSSIARLLEFLALPEVRTFGFGDSANDLEMLDACDEAIVMGDARDPRALEHATYVTEAVLDDGLAHAIHHFGLA